MKRREAEIFNLSFLDVLTGALGAVLFLFIVVPKGDGKAPAVQPELQLVFDTVNHKFYGDIPDSLLYSDIGDSLLAIVFNFDKVPTLKDCPPQKPCPDVKKYVTRISTLEKQLQAQTGQTPGTVSRDASPTTTTSAPSSAYKGDLPSVPCKFSVEMKWNDMADNVDLFVCKDGNCVYGGRKRFPSIGFWDSGKSRTSIFGGDLRTTQEAVRQFDEIIPGEYKIYAQYKESDSPKEKVTVYGLVYSRNDDNVEQGETFSFNLPLDGQNRMHIGDVSLSADGKFTFRKANL